MSWKRVTDTQWEKIAEQFYLFGRNLLKEAVHRLMTESVLKESPDRCSLE